ncbi:MAG: cupin domain-containing protein [Oscillospiraceae bacterium]|jgi:transcriptional regulator with XRE-family HTH domain|nr:cupin domain-containing protein [Oscillospiraceae bacterium]
MTEQLTDIGRRLAALRQIEDFTAEDFAQRLGITPEDLTAYEGGQRDFSFSFLYNAAALLGVDVVDLMSGESPKLSGCCLVRGGGGFAVDRRAAYSYKHLAFTFRDKLAEPFMVTVAPKADAPEQHAHAGQEFDYVVSGQVRFFLAGQVYDLAPGDSVYYDSGLPHAMQATGGAPASFLAVVLAARADAEKTEG